MNKTRVHQMLMDHRNTLAQNITQATEMRKAGNTGPDIDLVINLFPFIIEHTDAIIEEVERAD
jgi:hypothetical protein